MIGRDDRSTLIIFNILTPPYDPPFIKDQKPHTKLTFEIIILYSYENHSPNRGGIRKGNSNMVRYRELIYYLFTYK